MSLTVASLHVYPIKSLGGFAVDAATLTDRGLEHDRRWMLVDQAGRFLSQREVAVMACLHTLPTTTGFSVTDVRNGDMIELPWSTTESDTLPATVWDDRVDVIAAPPGTSDWFARKLGRPCQLVYMPNDSLRPVDPHLADVRNSLSDGAPYLVISQASLDDLNARLRTAIGMERFRPNIVISGGHAFQEDAMREVRIGEVRFFLLRPCARCAITTTDQLTGERSPEPLRTLATYRRRTADGGPTKVDFGMNAMALDSGTVARGDIVTILGAH